MAINEYLSEDGKKLYRVRIVRRSAKVPGLKVAKKQRGFYSLAEAKKYDFGVLEFFLSLSLFQMADWSTVV